MSVGDETQAGRYCERCELRVRDAGALSRTELEGLVDGGGRTCLRVATRGGRPRLASGLVAGLTVALLGCATTPTSAAAGRSCAPTNVWIEDISVSEGKTEDLAGRASHIVGMIVDKDGQPIEHGLAILMSTSIPESRERASSERGLFVFRDLPPGEYTVQVLSGAANVSKVMTLEQGKRARVEFVVDPDLDQVLMGVLVEEPVLDIDSASSTITIGG